MSINWQDVITKTLQSGVLLSALAWLSKAIITGRFERELEEFKSDIKKAADREIEEAKASLSRLALIHNRQVDVLMELYEHLSNALGGMQRLSSSVRFAGDSSDEEYMKVFNSSRAAAAVVLSKNRLLVSTKLAADCDAFFMATLIWNVDIASANDSTGADVAFRKAQLDKARDTAFQHIPEILKQIEEAGRGVIHL